MVAAYPGLFLFTSSTPSLCAAAILLSNLGDKESAFIVVLAGSAIFFFTVTALQHEGNPFLTANPLLPGH
jgi:hypothetical protein